MSPSLSSKQIATIIVLGATCVATNYAMVPLPNVKLMDGLVFASGYMLGAPAGIMVGALAWAVYGQINPYGFSLPILLLTMSGESIYSLGGALLRRSVLAGKGNGDVKSQLPSGVIFGSLGILLTLAYDIYTNAVVGVLSYGSPLVGLLTMNFPVPMGLLHEVSNLAFFATVVPLIIKTLSRTMGRIDQTWAVSRRTEGVA